jgi:hypothetical protein
MHHLRKARGDLWLENGNGMIVRLVAKRQRLMLSLGGESIPALERPSSVTAHSAITVLSAHPTENTENTRFALPKTSAENSGRCALQRTMNLNCIQCVQLHSKPHLSSSSTAFCVESRILTQPRFE